MVLFIAMIKHNERPSWRSTLGGLVSSIVAVYKLDLCRLYRERDRKWKQMWGEISLLSFCFWVYCVFCGFGLISCFESVVCQANDCSEYKAVQLQSNYWRKSVTFECVWTAQESRGRGLQPFSLCLSIILHIQVCWYWIGWRVFGGRGFTERRSGWNEQQNWIRAVFLVSIRVSLWEAGQLSRSRLIIDIIGVKLQTPISTIQHFLRRFYLIKCQILTFFTSNYLRW